MDLQVLDPAFFHQTTNANALYILYLYVKEKKTFFDSQELEVIDEFRFQPIIFSALRETHHT